MLNLLELYEKYDYLVALLFSILMWLIGFFTKKFTKQIKQIKIKNVLRLKKGSVVVLIPDRYGKLTLVSEEGATELIDYFVTKDEMEAAFELKEQVTDLGLSVNISYQLDRKSNNIFCIGGPLSNINTARYFKNKNIFLPLTFGVHKDSQYLSERNRKKLTGFVHEDDSYNESGIWQGTIKLDGKDIYTFDRDNEGYVFLTRITSKTDFHNSKNEVIHLCFGNNSKTTLSAIKCYFEDYDDLNKIIKGKQHYCIIIRSDKEGNLDFGDFIDLTNDVFIQ